MAAPTNPDHYDFIALGSGEAGKVLAWTLGGKQGKRCAVVERRWIGGSCPNVACLPSKNLIYSAGAAHEAAQAQRFGLAAYVDGAAKTPLAVDMVPVHARKAAMVHGLVDVHLANFQKAGVEIVHGNGVFVSPKTIAVGERRITADNIALCTGSRARIDETIPGLVEAKPLTHVELLDLETLPSHLVILGGGYVGLEFAQAFKRFGSNVTVIEHHERVLKNEDKDVVDALVAVLEKEGVKFITSARVSKVSGLSGKSVEIEIDVAKAAGSSSTNGTAPSSVSASHILVTGGRIPNTDNIGLTEHAGVALTPSGHVQVDEQLCTTAAGVYAVGDCAGSPYFTHMGFDDFRVAYAAISNKPRPGGTTGRQVPSTLFTEPELAHVGLREPEAQAQGIKYRLAKLPMAAFLRSRTMDRTEGLAKVLVEADGDKILGFTALGPAAGEMLPVVQLAMKLGVGYQEIGELVLTHPTMNEGLVGLFMAVPPRQ